MSCSLIISNPTFISYFSGFTLFAYITKSSRGYPRIIHDGFTYGLPNVKNKDKERNIWFCTASDAKRKRCSASIETRIIDGYTMLKIHKRQHICVFKQVLWCSHFYATSIDPRFTTISALLLKLKWNLCYFFRFFFLLPTNEDWNIFVIWVLALYFL